MAYLGVMMFPVVDQARVGDASLKFEGLMVSVGSCCKDGSLTDLTHNQHLHCMSMLHNQHTDRMSRTQTCH